MSTSAAILRSYDKSALNSSQFVSTVVGKNLKNKKVSKVKALGASFLIIAMIIVFALLFGLGNIMPSTISERLIEETDVQYGDAVRSKEIVFQRAMYNGELPADTTEILEKHGFEVGYLEDGEYKKGNQSSHELVLKNGDKIITAGQFIDEVNTNAKLYEAFNDATYSRAAYYYDDSAKMVFKEIGTNRNNYTNSSEFDDVMNSKVGEGSDINVNSVSLVKKTRKNQRTGEEETYYVYEENGESANSNGSASEFINSVRTKNTASDATTSALFTADALKTADTISKEERSSLFYVTFMENVSKMKAGDGNESQINAAMNYLYDSAETEVLDVNSGEMVKVSGTALESPSLYAVLTGDKVDASKVENYSSDRILKTIENRLGVDNGGSVTSGTVASSLKMKGTIGRFISSSIETASEALISIVEPTVSSSLVDNSFDTIKGIDAGEFLVEGAVNVGRKLAQKSGATAGDANAVVQYARLNNQILAMDAMVDRNSRSPFDISSKNTFLGSIFYNFMINARNSKQSSMITSISSTMLNTTKSAAISLFPAVFADETLTYLSSFGDCETLAGIGAVGEAHCTQIATFDTSTLDDPFNDAGFVAFVNENTTLNSNGERTINKGSTLAKFILYNDENNIPVGIMNGGALDSLKNESSTISYLSNIASMVETFLGSDEEEKRIASGAAFVNSEANEDWQTYKYAQRYVSLARATAALKQYSNGSTAYNNITFFEGTNNPVIAFLEDYYKVAIENN